MQRLGQVDRRAGRVLRCVRTRLGFVPSAVQKHISYLQALKVSVMMMMKSSHGDICNPDITAIDMS